MGKNTPYIMEGDGESDIEYHIIDLLGLDWYSYLNDETILNSEVLELNMEKILNIVNDPSEDSGYFQILGYFILKTGATISNELKNKIAEATKWEYEKTIYPNKEMEEERKAVLKDLRDKILDHKPGKITRLIEDGGGYAPKLLFQKRKLILLLEKGYSLEQIKDFFARELSINISEEDVFRNIKWHFHINSYDLSEDIFKQAQRKVLRRKLIEYIGKGVRTLDEMNRNFISLENPDGIPFNELENLVKESLSISSWEDAIKKYGIPSEGWMDTYIKQVCGIDSEKFTEEEEYITREMIETHFSELVEMVSKWSDPKVYYKLGLLILKTGARLTEDFRKAIIEFTSDLQDFDEESIQTFQGEIRTHKI